MYKFYKYDKHRQINTQVNINTFMYNFYTTYALITKLKNKETMRCDPIKTPIPDNGAILMKAVFSGSQAKNLSKYLLSSPQGSVLLNCRSTV